MVGVFFLFLFIHSFFQALVFGVLVLDEGSLKMCKLKAIHQRFPPGGSGSKPRAPL